MCFSPAHFQYFLLLFILAIQSLPLFSAGRTPLFVFVSSRTHSLSWRWVSLLDLSLPFLPPFWARPTTCAPQRAGHWSTSATTLIPVVGYVDSTPTVDRPSQCPVHGYLNASSEKFHPTNLVAILGNSLDFIFKKINSLEMFFNPSHFKIIIY